MRDTGSTWHCFLLGTKKRLDGTVVHIAAIQCGDAYMYAESDGPLPLRCGSEITYDYAMSLGFCASLSRAASVEAL